ncbi:MAG TPA: DUF4832 domain-containing protein [Ktedonobacteraceae bacterium]|nr:DUF4832 domain-containing protein [Ktedonobacteraceae bacterium]
MYRKAAYKRRSLFIFWGVLLIVVVIAAAFLSLRSLVLPGTQSHQITQHSLGAGSVTFNPTIIPPSASEIGNPMRGSQYAGDEEQPPGWPITDGYKRFCWSAIEPTEGHYNFSIIDEGIAQAKARGYKFGWRIMPSNPGHACLPQYIEQVTHGDYNNPFYLQRAQALITALGQRYDNNPYVGLLDMSLYGCWGEWNEACGGGSMNAQNREKLIDMQYAAFPHKRFVMLTNYRSSLNYALTYPRALPTGIRIDCLGSSSLGGARSALEDDPVAENRWKIAPIYFEYCKNPDFATALQDIEKYHASIIGDGDGNIEDFSSYSPAQQRLMIEDYKAAGYRFELNRVNLPGKLTPGTSFTVISDWTNVNSAPAYLPWNVMIQLRSASGSVAWQGKSQLNLEQPFSDDGRSDQMKEVEDHFTLSQLAPGRYQLCIQITDPSDIYAPLALANGGRQSNGSYCVGSITVG